MNILIISYRFSPDYGGIETHSEMLANFFSSQGCQVKVITKTSIDSKNSLPSFSYEVYYKPSLFKIVSLIKWSNCVLENNPSFSLSWPVIFFKKIHLITIHTWINRTNGKGRLIDFMKKRLLNVASSVIACSNIIKNETYPNALVIENPYNNKFFKNYNNVRKGTFVFVGRFVSDKGIDIAIHAFNKLVKFISPDYDISFNLIGDGDEFNKMNSLVSHLELSSKIHFYGKKNKEEIVEILNDHKFIIVPSVWKEPFGIVALEGLACGCIPLVSDNGGLIEAIGNCGFSFKSGDVDSLFELMKRVLLEPSYIKNITPSMIDNHLKEHSIEYIGTKYLQLLTSNDNIA